MRNFESDAQFTNTLHHMMTHKIQSCLWDLLDWLDSNAELDSLRDLLLYIRLVADYGDAGQGKLFYDRIKQNKHLKNVSVDIANRYIRRGEETGYSWLKDLGTQILELQEARKEKEREKSEKSKS